MWMRRWVEVVMYPTPAAVFPGLPTRVPLALGATAASTAAAAPAAAPTPTFLVRRAVIVPSPGSALLLVLRLYVASS